MVLPADQITYRVAPPYTRMVEKRARLSYRFANMEKWRFSRLDHIDYPVALGKRFSPSSSSHRGVSYAIPCLPISPAPCVAFRASAYSHRICRLRQNPAGTECS